MLTRENYHSIEMKQQYMGNSQFGEFVKCESSALANIKGEFERDSTIALLVGSYVDAHFTGDLDLFKAKNPEIFTKAGNLKSEYENANNVIARIERDAKFMQYISGEHQIIYTGIIAGEAFKIMVDSLHPTVIVDLKIVASFEQVWVEKSKQNWIDAWNYSRQMAFYQEIVRQNIGETLPCVLAAATKEKHPNIGLFAIPQERLDVELRLAIEMIPRFGAIKRGEIAPTRCGACAYCHDTKVLTGAVIYE